MKKNITCKTQSFYILLMFLLINITLLIAVSIYCSLIKYRGKKKFITVESFDRNNIKIDKKSYKNILSYYIGYVTIKKSCKNILIYSVGYVAIKQYVKV